MRGAVAILAAFAVLTLAGPAVASESHPTLPEISGEVLCISCKEPLDMSNGSQADRERALISGWIAQGLTKSQIERRLVDQFGRQILLSPPKSGFDAIVWWLPIVGAIGGALVLGYAAWRWRGGRGGSAEVEPAQMGTDIERRLDEELARFEG